MSTQTIEITILHTNDMHSRLDAMSRLSAFARDLRDELRAQGRLVFFFDAGDAADRKERFCSITKGSAFPRILEAMEYDLQSLGNAISVTYGLPAASQMAARAAFPILAANFFEAGQPIVPGFRATASFALPNGLRLGVIGLTVNSQDIYRLFGVEVPDFRTSTGEWLATLNQEGRGPVVVLSHLGLREDRQLAEEVPGLDLIIGGHSHSALHHGETVNNVLIAQAGEYAQHLGRVDLLVDAQTGNLLEKYASLIPIPVETPLDPAVEAAIQEARQEAAEYLARPIGELLEALTLDYDAECGIGDLAADALRERMRADAALLTGGLFHTGLPAGLVTLGVLDAACFTTANPQVSLVSGAQLRSALESALEPERMASKIKAFRGTPMGWPAISGMQVVYDPAGAEGERIKSIHISGQSVRDEQMVRLAHTDAEVRAPYAEFGYLELASEQVLEVEVPTILPEVIADYLRRYSPVPRPQGGRWIMGK